MPTENPKISAYVPQIIYDRFKEFKEERKLSFSQAAIELFAEYFGINLAENPTKEFTGGLPDRVSQLEQIVADLKQSYVYLSEKVDFIQSTSGLPVVESDNNSVIPRDGLQGSSPDELIGEPFNELPIQSISKPFSGAEGEPLNSKLLIEQDNNLLSNGSSQSEFISEPPDLLSHQLEILESKNYESNSLPSDIPNELSIKINYPTLAIRLGSTEGSIRNKRSVSTTEQFTEWITKKDPDKITWCPTKEGKKVYYSPSNELTDEQKFNLREWLLSN
jgi:hypothetical protein